MGNYWTNCVRHPEDVGVGHIRRTVTFDTGGIAAGVRSARWKRARSRCAPML
jgi:hypothetical protein